MAAKKKKAKKKAKGTPLTELQRAVLETYQDVTNCTFVDPDVTAEDLLKNMHGDGLLTFVVFEAQDVVNVMVVKHRLVRAAAQLLETSMRL